MRLKFAAVLPAFLLAVPAVLAQTESAEFTVGDIRIEGLQRITEGTVYNYLPVNIGDRRDNRRFQGYEARFFVDVPLQWGVREAQEREASASIATSPPSPWLSARITYSRYFTVTTSISAQKIKDTTPYTASGLVPETCRVSFRAYSGLVPMSPNTTPVAASPREAVPATVVELLVTTAGPYCRGWWSAMAKRP